MKERPRLENWKKFPSGAISKCQSLRERMNRSNDNIIIFIFNKCVFVFFQKKNHQNDETSFFFFFHRGNGYQIRLLGECSQGLIYNKKKEEEES